MKYFSKTEKPSFRPLSHIMVLPTGSPQAPFGPSTHESKELGVVDDAVGVGVGLVQYLGDLLLGEQPRADLAVVTREPGGRAAQLALVLLPALGQKHV